MENNLVVSLMLHLEFLKVGANLANVVLLEDYRECQNVDGILGINACKAVIPALISKHQVVAKRSRCRVDHGFADTRS